MQKTKKVPTNFSRALKAARSSSSSYTQQKVGQETGIPRCKLSQYETGAKIPKESTFYRLLKYYRESGLINQSQQRELVIFYAEVVQEQHLENCCYNN